MLNFKFANQLKEHCAVRECPDISGSAGEVPKNDRKMFSHRLLDGRRLQKIGAYCQKSEAMNPIRTAVCESRPK